MPPLRDFSDEELLKMYRGVRKRILAATLARNERPFKGHLTLQERIATEARRRNLKLPSDPEAEILKQKESGNF